MTGRVREGLALRRRRGDRPDPTELTESMQGVDTAAAARELEWRGVAAEDTAELSRSAGLKLQERSLALLGSLVRPHRRAFPMLVVLVLLENAARLSTPWLVQRGIDLGVPPLLNDGSPQALLTVLAFMALAVVVQAVSRVWFLRRFGRIGQDVLLDLRRRVFRHFQSLDVAFHDRYTTGRAVSRLTSDTDAIAELMTGGFNGLVTAILTVFGVSLMLVILDWRLGLLCLTSMVGVFFLLRWFSRTSARTYRQVRQSSAMVIVHFVETMTGIRAVQAYRREPRNQELFTDLSDRYRSDNVKAFRTMAIFMPGIKLIGNIYTGVVLIVGGTFVIDGSMTVGVLTAFLLYLRQFFDPMQEISQFYNTFQSAASALEKLSGVLEEKPGVAEPTDPTPLREARGALDLEHVQFSYRDDTVVLPDLSLSVPAGQIVALVGTTGAGKTTIAKLLSRFYDPTEGRIRLDGIDLRQLSDADLRRAVTMVTQENFMFDGTIGDNIRFGRPSATDDEVRAAAAAVGAETFVDAMPDGFATDVGKRGGRLSAGQRQLVAFARAFLADPAVLILDEATSSLDIPSERLVQQGLRTILAGRTAIIIAHRLSTVEIADRVLVLEHGRILEDGPPGVLMNQVDGRYASLHASWVASLA